jgi:hypothetical protein
MCFILLLYQVHPAYPVLLAANREERRDRPATPPHEWPGSPRIWAGRDEVAGGTWLGVNEHGLLVAVTNRRSDGQDPAAPSRGTLCLNALREPTPRKARRYVQEQLAASRFNPFNLLAANVEEAWVGTWRGDSVDLRPGVHVVVSQGDVDDMNLARARRGRRLARQLDLTASLPDILEALGRICANQTRPEPICRPGGVRGTVSSSLIALDADGRLAAYLHAGGPPSEHAYFPIVDVLTKPAATATT